MSLRYETSEYVSIFCRPGTTSWNKWCHSLIHLASHEPLLDRRGMRMSGIIFLLTSGTTGRLCATVPVILYPAVESLTCIVFSEDLVEERLVTCAILSIDSGRDTLDTQVNSTSFVQALATFIRRCSPDQSPVPVMVSVENWVGGRNWEEYNNTTGDTDRLSHCRVSRGKVVIHSIYDHTKAPVKSTVFR